MEYSVHTVTSTITETMTVRSISAKLQYHSDKKRNPIICLTKQTKRGTIQRRRPKGNYQRHLFTETKPPENPL